MVLLIGYFTKAMATSQLSEYGDKGFYRRIMTKINRYLLQPGTSPGTE